MTTDKRAAAIAALGGPEKARCMIERVCKGDRFRDAGRASNAVRDLALAALEADDGRALLRNRLADWCVQHGAALCPGARADTFGEGMREAKRQVRDILDSAAPEQPAPEPAAPHADDEARIAVKLCEKAEGGTCGPEDALREAMELCNSLAAGKAKAEAELAKQTQRENEGVRIFDGIVADLRAKLAEAEKAHEQDQEIACADEASYLKQIAALQKQTRCPECGCASPEDAEAAECGCEEPVCMVPASSTLAREFVKALAERDAALAAQNARAVEELEALLRPESRTMVLGEFGQMASYIHPQTVRDRIAALRAAKPEPAAEPAPERHHRANVCGIRRKSDGYWWQCDSEHGAGWNDKRIRQAWTMRAAHAHIADMRAKGMLREEVEVVELAPAEPVPAAADDEKRIAEIMRKHAKGWVENNRLLIDDALLLATDTIRSLAARAAKAEAEVERLRKALIDCGRQAGCVLADDVSTGFLCGPPGVAEELRAFLDKLRARDVAKENSDLRAKLADAEKRAANWRDGHDRVLSTCEDLRVKLRAAEQRADNRGAYISEMRRLVWDCAEAAAIWTREDTISPEIERTFPQAIKEKVDGLTKSLNDERVLREQEAKTAVADEAAYRAAIKELKHQTRCPECGCATPEDADASECGCDAPVCARPAGSTLAQEFVKATLRAEKAEGEAKALRAERDNYARSHTVGHCGHYSDGASCRDSSDCITEWCFGCLLAEFHGMKAERDAALAAQNARAVVPDPLLRDLIVAVYRMRDEWAESAEPVRNRLWAAVVQAAKRFEAEVFPLRTVPAAADAKPAGREGDEVLREFLRWSERDDVDGKLDEGLEAMRVLCRRALGEVRQ